MSLEKLDFAYSDDVKTNIASSLSSSEVNTYQLNTVYFQPFIGGRELLWSGNTTSAVTIPEDSRNFQYIGFDTVWGGETELSFITPYGSTTTTNFEKPIFPSHWTYQCEIWQTKLQWTSPTTLVQTSGQSFIIHSNDSTIPAKNTTHANRLKSIKSVWGYNRISGVHNG